MDVMMNMTTDDVRVLRKQFTGRMNLEQFVATLKKTLHDRIHSELDFVVGVVELFHTIDVNGDEVLDWDEFAGYMMDAGQAKADFYFDDLLLRTKRYQHVSLPLRDDKTPLNNVRTTIQQMLFLHDQHALAYFERDSDVVYLYTLHFDRNDAPRHVATMRLHTAFQEHTVICIEYVPSTKLLVVSSMLHVGYVSTWSVADLHSPTMVHRVESLAPHELLCWVPALQCLLSSAVVFPAIAKRPPTAGCSISRSRSNVGYTGGGISGSTVGWTGKGRNDGYRPHAALQTTKLNQLMRWDVASSASRRTGALVATELAVDDRLKGVRSLVTFKCINRTHVAIGCDDGVITVIDAESCATVSAFDAHSYGVKMLAYSHQTECLASIGCHSYADETTLHVALWRKRGPAGRLAFEAALTPHVAPLECVAFVDSRRQLLSFDASGVVFVYSSVLLTPTSEPWEVLQQFHTVAGLSLTGPHRIESCFVVPETTLSDAVLVTAGRSIAFYDHCDVKAREEVLFCHYCDALRRVVGVTPTKLLFWHADSGKLAKTFAFAAILAAAASPLDVSAVASVPSVASGPAFSMSRKKKPSGSRGTNSNSGRSETLPTITAACMDDRERKIVVGDDTGRLVVLNAVNGNVMKALDPHAVAVASVAYALGGKRVLSVAIDGARLHIYDENNALGYYVPFGGLEPQSVLLHALRFLPEVAPAIPTPAMQLAPSLVQQQQERRRRRTRRLSIDMANDSDDVDGSYSRNSNSSTNAQPGRFEIIRSVGNVALDRVAVLVAGSQGESFVQVWDFDMSHTHGTCVAPRRDEITCIAFAGATSVDIVGGTAAGRVFLWRAVHDDPGYECVLELECSSDDRSSSDSKQRASAIHHIITIDAASSEPPPAVDDANNDATSTFELTDVSQPTDSSSQNNNGMYVIAGDDLGVVTTWLVLSSASTTPHAHVLLHTLSVRDASVKSNSESAVDAATATPIVAGATDTTGALLQHEEMVLGYDTVAALFMRACNHKRDIAIVPVAPLHYWAAHTNSILSLRSAATPRVVLTSSTSGRIKIWTIDDGTLLGVLDDFASRRAPEPTPWRFPLDMAARRQRMERDALPFLDRCRNCTSGSGTRTKQQQPRASILQQRLALSNDELLFDYSAEKKSARRRTSTRHARLAVRSSDISCAIRRFVLAQAAPSSASAPVLSRRLSAGAASASDAQDSSRSLQVVLKEIDELQLQTTARSGSAAGLSMHCDNVSSSSNAPAQRMKKRYTRVTLADVKPLLSLRPRTSSSNAVHCELSLPTTKPTATSLGQLGNTMRPKEVVYTSTSVRKGAMHSNAAATSQNAHLTLHDLRDEAARATHQSAAAATPPTSLSNQDAGRSSKQNATDSVLKYHVKLAHSWQQQYQVQ